MTIPRMPATALAALVALVPGLAAAQTPPAAETPQPGQPYVAAEHRDWQVICTRVEGETGEACEIYQLLREANGQPIAEISIAALALTGQIIAGATITTPLETFLPAGLGFRIGAQADQMRVEEFRVCTVVGCVVRMGLSAAEVQAMERGSDAFITILPFVALDRPVDIAISLRGFTAAMRDLRERTPNAPEAIVSEAPAPQQPAAARPALPPGPLVIDPSALPPTPPTARP